MRYQTMYDRFDKFEKTIDAQAHSCKIEIAMVIKIEPIR